MIQIAKNLLSNSESVDQFNKDLDPIVKALNNYGYYQRD